MVFVSPEPLDPATIRETIEKVVNDPRSVQQDNPGAHGAMVGKLNEACGGNEGRYAVLWWLFPHKWGSAEEVSSKALTGLEWHALQRWIGMREVQGEWMTRATFRAECSLIMERVIVDKMDAKHFKDSGWDSGVDGRRMIATDVSSGKITRALIFEKREAGKLAVVEEVPAEVYRLIGDDEYADCVNLPEELKLQAERAVFEWDGGGGAMAIEQQESVIEIDSTLNYLVEDFYRHVMAMPTMACGHVADKQMESGKPYCSQCWMGGRNPDAEYEVK